MADSPWRPLAMRLGARSLVALDAAAAVGYAVLAVALLADQGGAVPAAVGAAMVAAPLAVHRRQPLAAYAVLVLAMSFGSSTPALGFLALPPLALVLAGLAAHRRARVVAPALLLGIAACALPDLGHNGAAAPFGMVLVAACAVGVAVGQQRRYTSALLAHRVALAEERARDAVADERLRLARELHDVVAHRMSAVTVQAAYGNLVFADRPDEARAALGAVETMGRQALDELRDLLGVLREPGNTRADLEPAPSLGDLDRLVAETASAGVVVKLAVTGHPTPLPDALELSAFRIVQEALTNVVRHARTGAARVALDHEPDTLTVAVADDGCGPPPGWAAGHGLVGIRERVALAGGTLVVGPGPAGGFRVEARLPLPDPGA